MLQTGQPVVSNFKQEDPAMGALKDELVQLGIKSGIVFPLKNAGKVIGVFGFYSGTEDFFDEQEIKLLEEVTHDISFALDVFEKEKLRAQLEEERNMFFDISKDMIGIAGINGYFYQVNPAFERILGYTPEEFCSTPFVEFIHPDDLEATLQEVENSKKGISTISFTNRFRCKDGSYRWLEWSVEPVDKTLYCTARDITEDKKLRDLNRQTRQLAKVGSWEVDMVNQKLYWSEEVHQLHETDAKSFVPDLETAINFYREDFRQLVNQSIEKSVTTGAPFDFEAVLVTANKKEIWVRAIGNAEFAAGTCTRIYGSFQDIHDRKKAEALLQASENKFRSLIENSADMLTLINADGKMEYISPSVERTIGYTNEENKTLQIKDAMHPDDLNMAMETLEKAFKTPGVPIPSTVRNRKKDGTYIWVEGTITNMLHVPGVNAIVANIRDITERKKAEEQQALFSNIVNSSYDAILGCSLESVIYSWNTGAEKIFGFPAQEIIGKKVYEIIPPDLKHEEIEIIEKIKRGESIEHFETERVTKSGERIFVSITVSPIKDTVGNIFGVSKILRNITESKKAEEEIKFHAHLLSIVGQATIATDVNGKVTFWNNAAESIYGWNKEEALGKNILDLTPSTETKEQAKQIIELLSKGNSWAGEFKVKRKDGLEFPIYVTNSPIYNEKNELIGIIGISFDITERKKNEEKLADSIQQYRQLASQLQLEQLRLTNAQAVAKVGSWETEFPSLNVTWSDEAFRIFGTDKESFNPTHEGFLAFVHPLDREKVDKALLESAQLRSQSSNMIEHRIVTSHGEEKVIEEKWKITYDDKGEPLLAIGSCQDITERKKAEADIKDSEEKRRLIMNGALDAIISIDTDGNITFWNPKAETIFGWKEAEVMGQQLSELIIPEQFRKHHKEGMKHYLDTGEGKILNKLMELKALNRKGKEFPVELTILAIQQGQELFFTAFLRDITDRKKAEKNIRLVNERLQIATHATNLGIWDWDVVNNNLVWDKTMYSIFGVAEDKFSGAYEAWAATVHPDDIAKGNEDVQNALTGDKTFDTVFRIVWPDKSIRYIKGDAIVIRDEAGKPLRMIGSNLDITKRKEAEEKIEASEAKLQEAQAIAQIGNFEMDLRTKEMYWSNELYNLLGYVKDEVSASAELFFSGVHPDDVEDLNAKFSHLLATFENASNTFRFVRKDGTIRHFHSKWQFDFDNSGKPGRLFGTMQNITSEKEKEEEREKMIADMIQRNRDLEQFTFIISHNLRAPTANIIGFTENLQDETLTPQEQKEFLQGLASSVAGLDTVIKDINTILQVKREVNDRKEIIKFSNLVGDIMLSIGNLIDKHRVRIKPDFSEVDEIYSLKVYMYSIFYNLISNSIKYSNPNEQPLIEIISKKENGKIILTFKDNGLGIDMKTKGDKVFGLYKRFHSHVEGKGMGLFMVKTQVESLGGKISIVSELNKGTEFTIVFENIT
ncbi:hypothetical protein BH11BAC1_BH11BAC1_12380 [soil metagenome]